MASIRKRGGGYLIIVSMGYDHNGKRRPPQQKTVHPPEGLTQKQTDKWLQEQATLFEMTCKNITPKRNPNTTLAEYTEIWLQDIAPTKLAKSTIIRERQDTERFLPVLGGYKLTELTADHFRKLYADMRKKKNKNTGKPLSEATIEGVHACLCGILSDAMEGGFIDRNPAWRTFKYSGKKFKRPVADEDTAAQIIAALGQENIKYETYFKLVISTGMRRGECCGLKWSDFDYNDHTIHIHRNVVKLTGEDIIVKPPKTAAGDRYVYFSAEMESLLEDYRKYCEDEAEQYEKRQITDDDYLFRRKGTSLPMTPTTFTWRFKNILRKYGLPDNLNVHSLRHTAASLMIAGGTDPATVAGLLGHSQVSTTLDIYTHAFDKNKRAASEKLQEALEV